MRRLAGASILVVMVAAALVAGTMAAFAEASFYRAYDTSLWAPLPQDPSGVTYIGDNETGDPLYLVVDQNNNDPNTNGYTVNPVTNPAAVQTVATGVAEPTGVHYDESIDTLFISSDSTMLGGHIVIRTQYRAGGGQTITFDAPGDTEDPAYDPVDKILYWATGSGSTLNWMYPGEDLSWNTADTIGSIPIPPALLGAAGYDWEALAWSDEGHLLLVDRNRMQLFRLNVNRDQGIMEAFETIDLSFLDDDHDIGDIAGMGIGPASYDDPAGHINLWVTSRNDIALAELTLDNAPPQPPPPTTLPTSPTSTAPTTTAPSTTTTTKPGQTTTTTTPGQTTTTTTPGGGGGGGGGGPVGPSGFTDIAGSTHAADIEWLADQGITKGCNPPSNTKFCPNQSVTRGQMAAFLGRAFRYTDAGTGNYFVDTIGNTFKTDIDRLRVAGVTLGCNPPTNNRYCPDDEVTRGQMAAFLGRAFGYTDAGTGSYFVDTAGSTFKTDIDRLRAAGVTLGCNPPTNNRYCPDEPVTRGQMATFLRRGFNN